MDDSFNHDMEEDQYDEYDDEDPDLQQTQSTQQASQQPQEPENHDDHLWGYLQPCSPGPSRVDFWKLQHRYTIGRNIEVNRVVFPGFKISNQHCVISWDGDDSMNASIFVEDKSSNGTFINGEKIGKGNTRIVRDGNEIAFGSCVPQRQNEGVEDYRFIYRHTAGGRPNEGIFIDYDLGADLGSGSFATVRKALHKASGRWFAAKIIAAGKSVGKQQDRNQNLIREISIMEKLDHRNICKLYDVFFHNDDTVCLVLELVEGGDLLDHIMKTGGIAEIPARDITYQMCSALEYIHSCGVTHRDLKPENVLLTKHKPPLVKVADFGLAKVVNSFTMLRTMCGTPSYLAPEVVSENGQGYDNRVDSWSVGVIVFAMLSNSGPFVEDEKKIIKERILTRQIVWGPLLEKDVSREALSFVQCLLQTYPEHRMTMTESLDHPWLLDHIPFHPEDFDESQLNLHPNFNFGAPLFSPGGSPNSVLRRRSDVVADAERGGSVILDPPNEMAVNLMRPNPSTPPGRGQRKRMQADLSILPEDSLEHVYAEAAARQAAAAANTSANANRPVSSDASLGISDAPRRSTRRTKPSRGR